MSVPGGGKSQMLFSPVSTLITIWRGEFFTRHIQRSNNTTSSAEPKHRSYIGTINKSLDQQ